MNKPQPASIVQRNNFRLTPDARNTYDISILIEKNDAFLDLQDIGRNAEQVISRTFMMRCIFKKQAFGKTDEEEQFLILRKD